VRQEVIIKTPLLAVGAGGQIGQPHLRPAPNKLFSQRGASPAHVGLGRQIAVEDYGGAASLPRDGVQVRKGHALSIGLRSPAPDPGQPDAGDTLLACLEGLLLALGDGQSNTGVRQHGGR
jgi:hypothetical protein